MLNKRAKWIEQGRQQATSEYVQGLRNVIRGIRAASDHHAAEMLEFPPESFDRAVRTGAAAALSNLAAAMAKSVDGIDEGEPLSAMQIMLGELRDKGTP